MVCIMLCKSYFLLCVCVLLFCFAVAVLFVCEDDDNDKYIMYTVFLLNKIKEISKRMIQFKFTFFRKYMVCVSDVRVLGFVTGRAGGRRGYYNICMVYIMFRSFLLVESPVCDPF